MKKSKILVYVLAGAWNTSEVDGTGIVGVEEDIRKLNEKLEHIKETRASEYLEEPYGDLCVSSGDRYYEVTDSAGGYAKFYITEHTVELSETIMGQISRDMEKIDRANDVEEFIHNQYEAETISAWMYEYMTRKEEVIEQILQKIDKWESCNTPYNVTLENVVEDTEKEIVMTDKVVEFLWKEFGGIPIDDDECILDDFMGFDYGMHREEVWRWFDDNYSAGGVAALMYGKEKAE